MELRDGDGRWVPHAAGGPRRYASRGRTGHNPSTVKLRLISTAMRSMAPRAADSSHCAASSVTKDRDAGTRSARPVRS